MMTPEERAAELADQVMGLAFSAWARQDAEHREAAQKLARKVVRLIREAENDALERAAEKAEISAVYFGEAKGVAIPMKEARACEIAVRDLQQAIRSLKHGSTPRVSDENPKGEDPEGLSAEGIPARCHNVTDALSPSLSPKEQKGE